MSISKVSFSLSSAPEDRYFNVVDSVDNEDITKIVYAVVTKMGETIQWHFFKSDEHRSHFIQNLVHQGYSQETTASNSSPEDRA